MLESGLAGFEPSTSSLDGPEVTCGSSNRAATTNSIGRTAATHQQNVKSGAVIAADTERHVPCFYSGPWQKNARYSLLF